MPWDAWPCVARTLAKISRRVANGDVAGGAAANGAVANGAVAIGEVGVTFVRFKCAMRITGLCSGAASATPMLARICSRIAPRIVLGS